MRNLIILVLVVLSSCCKEKAVQGQVKSSLITIEYLSGKKEDIQVNRYSRIILNYELLYFETDCINRIDNRYYNVKGYEVKSTVLSNCQ